MSKAVVMISGGLDSILAVMLLKKQGIDVVALNFDMGFGQRAHRKKVPSSKKHISGIDILRDKDIKVVTLDVAKDFFDKVVINPKYGYGKGANPCIDCKIYMQKRAWEYAQSVGADFIATGEVLAQRPMSQMYSRLMEIERAAGLTHQVVRPLCARLLPPSIPEQEGLVDRNGLYDFSGRSRTRQFELARKFNIDNYETPAGGCFLAEPAFSRRFFDLMEHTDTVNADFYEFQLLKVGVHFRFSDTVKLIKGRNYYENRLLVETFPLIEKEATGINGEEVPGPFAVLTGKGWENFLDIACRVVARYCDKKQGISLPVVDKDLKIIDTKIVDAIGTEEASKYRLN
jgi:hypothetical protein